MDDSLVEHVLFQVTRFESRWRIRVDQSGATERRRMLRQVSVLVIMALGLSSWAAHAQVTEHQPKILFDGGVPPDRMNTKQIYVVEPDGSHVQSLTETPPGTMSGFAAWSPDRQKIAFISGRGEHLGDPEIYVMAADGSDIQRLTRHKGFDAYPAWSPDGHQIAFVRDTDPPETGPVFPPRSQSIYVMDSDGSNVRRLTEFETGAYTSWSPDGERIAFEANLDGIWEICVMETDGSNVQRLTHTPGENTGSAAPDWSPDGQKIVFDSNRDGNVDVYVMGCRRVERRATHAQRCGRCPARVVARWAAHRLSLIPRRGRRDLCHGCRRWQHGATHV